MNLQKVLCINCLNAKRVYRQVLYVAIKVRQSKANQARTKTKQETKEFFLGDYSWVFFSNSKKKLE